MYVLIVIVWLQKALSLENLFLGIIKVTKIRSIAKGIDITKKGL